MRGHRLAVWGDPIAHSRSPALHAAAYRELGLDWHYDRRRVTAEGFSTALESLDDSWRGLSVTMPLKEEAFRAAGTRDRHAELTGAVNTLLLDTRPGPLGARPAGFNTDVGGILDALAEDGFAAAHAVRVLGAGATAASALVAAAELGTTSADVRARRPERAAGLVALGERLGLRMSLSGFDAPATAVDLTFATLPSGTDLGHDRSISLAEAGGALFEAAYAPWPSALAASWGEAPVTSGLSMLLHQAVRQVRVFLHGDAQRELDDESRVLAAMRSALHDRS